MDYPPAPNSAGTALSAPILCKKAEKKHGGMWADMPP